MLDSARRLGILGGTFDPIHFGHLRTAELVREAFSLDHIVFVPNGWPAHKDNNLISVPQARLAMAELAVASNPRFSCSRIEFEREGPSYALDTVRAFRQLFPSLETLCWIIGADTIGEIPTWHRAAELVRECQFIAVTRPGYERADPSTVGTHALPDYVSFLPAPGLEISSTRLRDDVRAGRSIRYLVPPSVEEYIHREGLYAKTQYRGSALQEDRQF